MSVDTSSSFRTLEFFYGKDGGKLLKAIVLSGIDGDTPVSVIPNESGYQATALAASTWGYVGVPEGGSIASGAVGTIRIGGYRAGVQASAAAFGGTAGEAIGWTAGTLYGSASSMIGADHQVGVITETTSASTTANIFLAGRWATPV
jgi:hypothetical protein